MSTIIQTLQRQRRSTDALPVSHQMKSNEETSIRRRLSSLSMKIQPSIQSWSFPRSKSMATDSDGISLSSVTRWWGWGWTWVLSKKPSFSADLEMNEEEAKAIGSHNKGSWRHVFYKVRSEIRRFVAASSDHDDLPVTNKSRSFRSI